VTRCLIDDFGVNKGITTAPCNNINPRDLALRLANSTASIIFTDDSCE
jgi:hypothetical protein